jgi:hypothetical protein
MTTWAMNAQIRPMLRPITLLLLGLVLSGCLSSAPGVTYTLTVHNYCLGANYTVRVYTNEQDRGIVTTYRDFSILAGDLDLRAVGTGIGGTTFEAFVYVTSDILWTLCPE